MNVWVGDGEWGRGRNNTERGRQKQLEMNLFQRHFFNHEPQMDWPGVKPGPLL